MSKPALHVLTIEPLPRGRFRLFGQHLGKQIRIVSKNPAKLEKLKKELDGHLEQARKGPTLRNTWLTDDQLRDAEAAFLLAKVQLEHGRRLTDLVSAGAAVISPEFTPKIWKWAIGRWLQYLRVRLRRYPETLTKNKNRMRAFARQLPGRFVHETTPEQVERWVLRSDVAERTQLTDGAVIRAFFNFALKQRWCVKSPLEVDLRELAGRAGNAERPRILTTAQCQSLLTAAAETDGGVLLPYFVLSCWCFMRHAEVTRTKLSDLCLDKNRASATIEPRKRGTASYRVVTIPENARVILERCVRDGLISKTEPIFFKRHGAYDRIREKAGLVKFSDQRASRHAQYKIKSSIWQENILRHTGLSYLYQECGDVREVCRQAGNSSDTAFKHYLHLPEKGACKKFYSARI